MGFAYYDRRIPRQTRSIEAQMESSNREERAEETDSPPVPQGDEPAPEAGATVESVQSEEWWSASEAASDWAQPVTDAPTSEAIPRKQPRTADVYFCGHPSLFPLNRALRAIANERLTGSLRSFSDLVPIE